MRNNAIKKIPKDFGNGAMETMFEETTDEAYRAASREIQDHANREMIDVQVDTNTGEVLNPGAFPETTQEETPVSPAESLTEPPAGNTPPVDGYTDYDPGF